MPSNPLNSVRERIRGACLAAGRPASAVRLLAVSKTHPAAKIRYLHHSGQRLFGENYVDEALAKQAELDDLDIEWHFVGPVQSNKTRALSEHFDWVQSVEREKIIRRLADQRPEGLGPLNVLIQVNLDQETTKSGCRPDEIAALADAVAERGRLRLRGLMAIPAPREDPEDQYRAFCRLRALFDELKARHPEVDTLSAGMSDDLEAAVRAGSTMVRVGTALFGPRE